MLRKNGLNSGVDVFPAYLTFEAEEEGQYKSYRGVLRDTAIRLARHLNVSIAEEQANQFAASVPSWPPFSDTVESLKEMGRKGYKRIILSNIDRGILDETVLQNGLEVDGYITAEDVGSYKPAYGHWNRFFQEYKASKDSTLHVAHSICHDIIPCTELGICTAWINRYSEAPPSGLAQTYVFSDLRSLLSLLA